LFGLRLSVVIASWQPAQYETRNQYLTPAGKEFAMNPQAVRNAVATSGDVGNQSKVADGASELLQDVFGKDRNPGRLVCGVASLPLGAPVPLELIFEVAD
jgi:hypothetical protein